MSRIDDLITELAPGGVPFKALEDLAVLVRGNGMPKTDLTTEGVGAIHYGQIYTHYGVWAEATLSFVTPETAGRLATADPGDIIITNTSENLEDVGKAVAWLGVEPIVTGGHATIIKHHEDPKFLSYWFQSASFFAQKKALATGTKVIDVSAKQLAKVRVPVPPIEVQTEIARVLDDYSKVENELKAQLEAETRMRREQFRFFRTQLLVLGGDDVRSVTLPEVSVDNDGRRRPVTKSARVSGDIPYYGASGIVDYVSDFIFDGDYLLVSEDGANLLARSTPIAFSVSGKTWVNNHAHVLEFMTDTERRFVELYLNSIDLAPYVTGAAQPKLNKANLNAIRIPWPSPDEQARIVSTLDSLQISVGELVVNLSAEMITRRKQYEYYRNRLFAFEELPA